MDVGDLNQSLHKSLKRKEKNKLVIWELLLSHNVVFLLKSKKMCWNGYFPATDLKQKFKFGNLTVAFSGVWIKS